MQPVETCINCGRAADGAAQKFCPECGQPTPPHRIDWKFLAHELEHSVLHMDRGVLYTLKSLVIRPEHLIREYLQGQRVKHVKPFLLMLMMLTLLAVIDKYVLGKSLFDVPELAGLEIEGDNTAFMQMAQEWMSNNLPLFTLLLLPLQAATLRLAFKSYREANYPEWLVITAF